MTCSSLLVRVRRIIIVVLFMTGMGLFSIDQVPFAFQGVATAQSVGTTTVADTTEPRVVQPGAPGQATRVLSVGDLEGVRSAGYTAADVVFMQGMIVHHAQAVEMTALVPERTHHDAIRRLAHRMERSQGDEIALMARWLEERGEAIPPLAEDVVAALEFDYGPHHGEHGHHGHHGHDASHHDHEDMHGMLSPEQMEQLAAASGEEFDRLFLEFMIFHHEGAITMVKELYEAPGAAQDGTIDVLASHIESDQRVEIARMLRLLDQM